MHALKYSFDEAVASLWRGRRSGLLSMATIAVALFVLGGFLLATSNLERLGVEWSRAAEMSIYLHDEVTPAQKIAIERLLAPGSTVTSYEFVSKTEALRRFRQTFTDLAAAVDSLDANALPASYEVRLRSSASAQADVEALGAKLRSTAGVDDVRYDRQWLDRLQSAVGVVRTVGFVLGALLTIAAALTVANVIQLAFHARRDEIEIMQLVGAPQAFVRGPFVMEGILHGGVGALAALAALAGVFLAMRASFLAPLAAAVNLSSFGFLSLQLCALLVVGGMMVGCVGGLVAASGRV